MYEFVPKQGDKAVVKRGSAGLLDAADPEGFLTYDRLVKDFGMTASIFAVTSAASECVGSNSAQLVATSRDLRDFISVHSILLLQGSGCGFHHVVIVPANTRCPAGFY